MNGSGREFFSTTRSDLFFLFFFVSFFYYFSYYDFELANAKNQRIKIFWKWLSSVRQTTPASYTSKEMLYQEDIAGVALMDRKKTRQVAKRERDKDKRRKISVPR